MRTASGPVLVGCILVGTLLPGPAAAQFRDDFDGSSPQKGWTWFTGDGHATIDFRVADGHATMLIDARKDRDNIWWALIKRNVASSLDLPRLSRPGYGLRMEARVRVHEAPRRVHLQINTQKTTDYDANLREFDLPDTLWHAISMTSADLGAGPGDSVNVEVGYTDAGFGTYVVDVDYVRADVVKLAAAPPDVGGPLKYHPQPAHADPAQYAQHVDAAQAAVVDEAFPDVNFARWVEADSGAGHSVVSIGTQRFTIVRFDLRPFAGRQASGHGIMELTTRSVRLGPNDPEEFGQLRVFEILGGDPAWERGTVTLERLLAGQPFDQAVNPQMLFDGRVAGQPGAKTRITISRAVLQRLLDGRTKGLLLRPLGPFEAAFDAGGAGTPRLNFDLEPADRRSTTPTPTQESTR